MKSTRTMIGRACGVAAALCLAEGGAGATNYFWKASPSSANWATGANWDGEVAPPDDTVSDAWAVFRGTSSVQPGLAGARNVTGVWLMNGGWTLGSANTLTLGPRGLRVTGGGTNTVNLTLAPVTDKPALLTVAGGSLLDYTGAEPGGGPLRYEGAGTIRLSGASANNYGLTFLGRLTELNLSAVSESSAYTIGDGVGPTNSQVVRVTSTGGNQVPNANAQALTINSSARLDLNGQNEVVGKLKLYGGQIVSGGGSLTVNSGTGAGYSQLFAESVVDLGTGTFYFPSGEIAMTAPLTFKAGALDLNGATTPILDSYSVSGTGGIVLDASAQNGTLTVKASNAGIVFNKAGGAGLNVMFRTGDNTSTYRAKVNNAFGTGTLSMDQQYSGRKIVVTAGDTNAVVLGNNVVKVNGGDSSGNLGITFGALAPYSGGMTFTGAVTIFPEVTTLNKYWGVAVNNPNTSSNNWIEFSGNMTEDSTCVPAVVTKKGSGTLVLSGQNTFSGTMTLDNGVLRLGSDSAAAAGPLGTGANTLDLKPGANAIVLATKDASPRIVSNPFILNGSGAPYAFGDGGWWQAGANGDITLCGTGTLKATTEVYVFNTTAFSNAVGQTSTGYGLTKQGSGTLVLGGSNSFTGPLTVNAGTLKALGRAPGTGEAIGNALVLARAGKLWVKGMTGQSTLNNAGALTFSGANRVTLENVDAGQTTTLQPASLTRTAPGVIELTASNPGTREIFKTAGAAPSVSDGMTFPYYIETDGDFLTYDVDGGTGFNVVSYSGNKLDSGADTDLVSLSGGDSDAQRTVTGTVIRKAVKTSASIPGAGTPVLSLTGGTSTGNGLSFAGTASVAPKVTFGASAEGFIYVADSQTGTLNGGLETGTGAITKSGGGTLELGGTAYNTGNLNVLMGKVRLLVDNPITAARSASVWNGAELNLNGYNQTLAAVTLYGGTVDTGAGTLTLTGNMTVNRSGDTSVNTIKGRIDLGGSKRTFIVNENNMQLLPDTGLLLQATFTNGDIGLSGKSTDRSPIVLDADNSSWSGATTIGDGADALVLLNRATALGSGQIILSSSATLRNATTSDMTLANGWNFSSTAVLNIGAATDRWLTFNGPINVTASPNATDSRIYNTTFAGNITGASAPTLTQRGGVLVLSGDNRGYAGNVTLADNTAVCVIRVGSDYALSIGGTLTFNGGGIATADATPRTVSPGTFEIKTTTYLGDSVGTGKLTIATNPKLSTSPTFYVNSTTEFSGNFDRNGSDRSITKQNAGLLIFSGTNVFSTSGGTLAIAAGALREASQYALGGSGLTVVQNLDIQNGVLELGFGDFVRALGTGTNQVRMVGNAGFAGYAATSPESTTRAVNLHGDKRKLNWGNTANFTSSGRRLVLGSTTANCAVDFQNDLDLFGDETYTREVHVADNTGAAYDKGAISGSITNGNPGGTYRQGARFAKTGDGVLELRGNNTYPGNTLVYAGTLLVNGINGTGVVDVWPGATLGGSGTINGPVAVSAGATLAPGSQGIGTLTVDSLVLDAGSTCAFEVVSGKSNDSVTVNGDLTLGGTLAISSSSRTGGGRYTLFTYTGALRNDNVTVRVPTGWTARLSLTTSNQVNLVVQTVGTKIVIF